MNQNQQADKYKNRKHKNTQEADYEKQEMASDHSRNAHRRDQRFPGGVAGGLLRGGVEEAAGGRRLELALEGQRLFDLIRFGKLMEVMNDIDSRDEGRIRQARPFVPEHRLMPIPQTALDKNANLVQNPGY